MIKNIFFGQLMTCMKYENKIFVLFPCHQHSMYRVDNNVKSHTLCSYAIKWEMINGAYCSSINFNWIRDAFVVYALQFWNNDRNISSSLESWVDAESINVNISNAQKKNTVQC